LGFAAFSVTKLIRIVRKSPDAAHHDYNRPIPGFPILKPRIKMPNSLVKTPVVFLVFNRPDTTAKVFDVIRQVKPPKLLVVADGPRGDRPNDIEKCAAVRKIIETVDWDCNILTNYSDINLGCKQRVSSGLDWAFNLVESAIILEDDCLPDLSFFPFCEELLEKYQDNERIMAISGDNFQFGQKRSDTSYYYSIFNHCWGWATWRRAWQHYDVTMTPWKHLDKTQFLQQYFRNPLHIIYWQRKFNQAYNNQINTWDYQWTFACWAQNGLTILPNVNLIANIGFDNNGTHHKQSYTPYANIPTEPISFPLNHPNLIIRNAIADNFTQKTMFGLVPRIYRKIRSILKI